MANLALVGTYGVWSSIAYFVMPFMDVRKDHPEWGLFTQLKKTVLPTPKVGDAAMSNVKCPRCRVACWRKHNGSEDTMDPLLVADGVPEATTTVIPFGKSYFDDEPVFSHTDVNDGMSNEMLL
jgi:hypothetical protein